LVSPQPFKLADCISSGVAWNLDAFLELGDRGTVLPGMAIHHQVV
jgi:hypothetical protein